MFVMKTISKSLLSGIRRLQANVVSNWDRRNRTVYLTKLFTCNDALISTRCALALLRQQWSSCSRMKTVNNTTFKIVKFSVTIKAKTIQRNNTVKYNTGRAMHGFHASDSSMNGICTLLERDDHLHWSFILWGWVGSRVADEANPSTESSGTVTGQDSGARSCTEGLMQRAFRSACLILAVSMRCCSYASAPLWIALGHADRYCASVSHELWSTPKSFMEALSVSLKRFFWPPWQRTPVCSSP